MNGTTLINSSRQGRLLTKLRERKVSRIPLFIGITPYSFLLYVGYSPENEVFGAVDYHFHIEKNGDFRIRSDSTFLYIPKLIPAEYTDFEFAESYSLVHVFRK